MPSKKAFNEANLFANQMYNNEIRKSILEQITVPDFGEVCKHLPSPEYATHTKNTLFTTKEQMADIECNTRGQSQSKLWFHERQGRLTGSHFGTVMKRRENVFPTSLLSKIVLPAMLQSPQKHVSGATVTSRLPFKNIWNKRILMIS